MAVSPAVWYHIDALDKVDAVSDSWTAFAEANNGEAVTADRVRGRVLWDFITDMTTVHLYETMVRRLRGGRPPIQFGLRCDSPDRRRLLDMHMSADMGGGILFNVSTIREEPRAPVPLLDRTRARDDRLIAMCAWCQRVRVPDRWVEVEEAVPTLDVFTGESLPKLTHGICPDCSRAMLKIAT